MGPIEVTTEPRRISSWCTSETMRWPPGRSTRANSVITGSSEGRCARARAQTTMSTEVTGSGSWVKSPDSKRASGTRRRANANMTGELSTPMTWCPPSETLGESSGATGSIQGHTGGQPVDDAIDERLIHVEQPVRLVIARRPLLITVDRCPAGGGDSRVRTEHGVVEKLSHLAEPAPGKRLVKVPGPPPQQPGLPAQGGRRAGVGRYSSVQARRKVGAATKGYSERRRLPRGSTPADTALPSGSRVITVQPDFEIDPSGKASPCGFALCRPQGPTPDH